MDTLFRRYGVLILAAMLAAASPSAWAQAAGRLLSVTGEVGIVGADGVRRSAERGGEIRQGDTIVTGPEALAQARMSDGGLISVRPDSEFKLEQFSYKGREDRSASFVVNILKGGFRTITGLIAQVNRPGYRIATPAATIGVRGTHFEVVHVLPQIASPQVPAGTYNRVFEGITTVQNPAGAVLQVVRDQTAFASLRGGSPTLVAPPALIFGRPTPVPRAALPQGDDKMQKTAVIKGEDRAAKMGRTFKGGDRVEPTTQLRSVPLTPIETTTIQVAPSTTTTISPTTTTISPTLSTTTTLSPTTTTTTSTSTLLSPTTTTISPTLSTTTTLSPTTTTTSTTTLTSPTLSTTTTLSPTTSTTTLSPSTSTILSPSTTTTTIK